jgi:hypothetical protein
MIPTQMARLPTVLRLPYFSRSLKRFSINFLVSRIRPASCLRASLRASR